MSAFPPIFGEFCHPKNSKNVISTHKLISNTKHNPRIQHKHTLKGSIVTGFLSASFNNSITFSANIFNCFSK